MLSCICPARRWIAFADLARLVWGRGSSLLITHQAKRWRSSIEPGCSVVRRQPVLASSDPVPHVGSSHATPVVQPVVQGHRALALPRCCQHSVPLASDTLTTRSLLRRDASVVAVASAAWCCVRTTSGQPASERLTLTHEGQVAPDLSVTCRRAPSFRNAPLRIWHPEEGVAPEGSCCERAARRCRTRRLSVPQQP